MKVHLKEFDSLDKRYHTQTYQGFLMMSMLSKKIQLSMQIFFDKKKIFSGQMAYVVHREVFRKYFPPPILLEDENHVREKPAPHVTLPADDCKSCWALFPKRDTEDQNLFFICQLEYGIGRKESCTHNNLKLSKSSLPCCVLSQQSMYVFHQL